MPVTTSCGTTALAAALRPLAGGHRLQRASTAAPAVLATATVTAMVAPVALGTVTMPAQALVIVVLVRVTATATAAALPGRPGRGTADTLCRLRPVSCPAPARTRPARAAYCASTFWSALACIVPTVAFGPVHSIAVALPCGLSHLALREGFAV